MSKIVDHVRRTYSERPEDTRKALIGLGGGFAMVALAFWAVVPFLLALIFAGILTWLAYQKLSVLRFLRPPEGKAAPLPSAEEMFADGYEPDTIVEEEPESKPADPPRPSAAQTDTRRKIQREPLDRRFTDPAFEKFDRKVRSGTHIAPRQTPVGTEWVSSSTDTAEVTVKSAIQFWCYALPAILFVLAFVIGLPLGARWGFMNFENAANRYALNPVPFMVQGALWFCGIMLILPVVAYFRTRPKVRIMISPTHIRYGGFVYDRQHTRGIQIGYKSNEADLRSSIILPSFGTQTLRLTYGEWGHDLPYVVNAYHADEIVNWLNRIIDKTGSAPEASHDPSAGRKIELL